MSRISGRLNKRKIENFARENTSSKAPKVEYTFTELPIDIIRCICAFLEVKDLLSFSLTCTSFYISKLYCVDRRQFLQSPNNWFILLSWIA